MPGACRIRLSAGSLLGRLDIEGELDGVAHEDAAGLKRGVPGEAEVLAADLGLGLEADLRVAPRILAHADELEGHGDLLGDAVDAEIAGHVVGAAALAHRGRGEGEGRELLDVEEVGALDVAVPALVARVEGKSSLGRLGLLIHSTAGFIDAGFDGHITLELSNVANLPITLYPNMKIGQVSFMTMTTPADNPYGKGARGSKYQGQRGPTPSRYFENFKR